MRPRSITGPILLVLIGVVFLLNNIWRDIPFWTLLSDYWPFLLIFIGVLGLVEVFFHVSRGSVPPPRPLAGTGLIWILVFAMFSFWGSRNGMRIGRLDAGGVSILGTDYPYDVNATNSTEGVTRVVLDNLHGNLSLKGEDGAGIKVTGRKTVRAFNRTDADAANSQSQIHIERQGDLLVVRAEEPRSMRMLSVNTDLDITIPRGLNVEARGRSGDLTIEDIDGAVDVNSGHGDVRLNRIGKDVKIESSHTSLVHVTELKGNLDLQGRGRDVQVENTQGQVTINGDYSGTMEFRSLSKPLHFQSSRTDFRAEQIPGDVTIDLSEAKLNNVIGPVRFETSSRDVQATDITNSLELTIEHGDIQLTQTKVPLPKMDVRSHTGDITLRVPANAEFEIEGRTNHGEIENEFGDPLEVRTEKNSGTIRGRSGSGPKLTLTTDRGKLSIRKN
ncbi:MAG: DUF4097 family beta strand repeat-containing protein [Terriglobia bacterium]